MSNKDKKLSIVFKALGNERRIQIVRILHNSPNKKWSVGAVADRIDLSIKSTSKHMLLLEQVGILRRKRKGPSVEYVVDMDDKVLWAYLKNNL